MNENQIKVIVDSLVEASKLGTTNALAYIKTGLEAFKQLKYPITDRYGNGIGVDVPYNEKGIRDFVDFMLVYLDEAIKGLEKDKSE